MIEIFAVLFTLICIWLTIKNNIHCWWTGIVSNLLYFAVFYDKHIYADASLQILFILQGAWAWWMWKKPKFEKLITKMETSDYLSVYVICAFIWALFVPILIYLNGNNPPADALVTTFSIVGIYLTAKRKVESWHFWILTDIIAMILYFRTGLYLSCGVYGICLIMACIGLQNWKKLLKNG